MRYAVGAKRVRPRGEQVVRWMMTERGPVTLSDDDAAAVAEYVRWLEGREFSAWNLLLMADDADE